MSKMNPEVDGYLAKAKRWRPEIERLRTILLDRGLTEELKWYKPCYTYLERNVVIIQGFKEHCAILFAKGALLSDPRGILQKPGENTQGARRISVTSVQQIVELEPVLQAYIDEAVGLEVAGLEVEYKKDPEPVPEELQQKFEALPEFEAAFTALTPGRQRAYILHFSAAKQSRTRESRIEKWMPKIFDGKGLNDR